MAENAAARYDSNNIPARGAVVSYRHIQPFTYEESTRAGIVTSFNYYFETCDAVYVEPLGGGRAGLVWFSSQDVRPA